MLGIPSPMEVINHAVAVSAPPIVQQLHTFLNAPIMSTIAADPILSWAETGRFSSHGERTAAGVHELYTQDRLAQALGVKESDVVKVVEVAQVIVAIYFGGAALGLWGEGSAVAVSAPAATATYTVEGVAYTSTSAGVGAAGVGAAGGWVSTLGSAAGDLAASAATGAVGTLVNNAINPRPNASAPAPVPVAEPAPIESGFNFKKMVPLLAVAGSVIGFFL